MNQRIWFGVFFITTLFIISAFIGLNQFSQLRLANEKIAILEKQVKTQSNDEPHQKLEKEAIEQTHAAKQAELMQQIQQLDKKIKELETEANKDTEQRKAEKKVFLTFDDGPSPLTNEILDILNKRDVKATFFTVGNMMEQYPEIVKKTHENGHMILPHSYSHNYGIYSTFDTFYKDFTKVGNVYQSILGFKAPPIFRFPGGSTNQSSFKYGGKQFMPNITADLRDHGYSYVDWNVISGDATAISNKPDKMLEQVVKGSQNKDFVVALFHDIAPNKSTVKILPAVIDFYQKNGYQFRTFRDVTVDEMDEMAKRGIVNKPINR